MKVGKRRLLDLGYINFFFFFLLNFSDFFFPARKSIFRDEYGPQLSKIIKKLLVVGGEIEPEWR